MKKADSAHPPCYATSAVRIGHFLRSFLHLSLFACRHARSSVDTMQHLHKLCRYVMLRYARLFRGTGRRSHAHAQHAHAQIKRPGTHTAQELSAVFLDNNKGTAAFPACQAGQKPCCAHTSAHDHHMWQGVHYARVNMTHSWLLHCLERHQHHLKRIARHTRSQGAATLAFRGRRCSRPHRPTDGNCRVAGGHSPRRDGDRHRGTSIRHHSPQVGAEGMSCQCYTRACT